jgi:hypothetical protein
MRRVGPTANRGFERFNRWFTSSAGVYQTLCATVTLVLLESFGAIPDPHGFYLLYWLTVYSAVTQPALAAAARYNEEKLEAVLHRMNQADETNAALLTNIASLLQAKNDDHDAA